jgi:homoserine kinase type II
MSLTSETIDQILEHYFSADKPWLVNQGKSGYNNTTRYIVIDNKKFILRIYETHKDKAKVKLEHEVLVQLNEIEDLPFKVPVPIYTKEGKTYLRLHDGSNKLACIYTYIEGENPVFDHLRLLYSFGKRTGEVLHALQGLHVQQPFIYRPYYEIEHTHPRCGIDQVVHWCINPPEEFKEFKSKLSWIAKQMLQFQTFVPRLKTLPHQVIHGDLNESNVLGGQDGTIEAILDFEFVTYDLRVMEVAVCISEIIVKEPNESILWEKLTTYYRGFSSVLTLTKPEIDALPILVQLRRLDVFVHFLGRYLDGIDKQDVLMEQITKTVTNQNWIRNGEEKLAMLWKGNHL